MDVNANKLTSACEAILFAYGEPMELSRLSEALGIEDELTEQLLLNLEANLEERSSGLRLLKLEDKYQLSTDTQYADLIRSVLEIKRNTPLSQAAFEVLAIVAYNQPITKSYIEQVRGVDCSGVISSLCQKKLIEEKGRLDLPGRPLVYGTTPEFLRCFSLSSLDDLPELPENETNKGIENEAEGVEVIETDNEE
ncbi:MAG: SMC-Scp complex subunit ScpB [Ruminococcaceae bacterium]|jgi:segregation and condensation protein B|nr:SMC-Scp complex subunit ScpB [Oscillospiraceae bacterium]